MIARLRLSLIAAALAAPLAAFAKTPGTTYCYRDICHRVMTIAETAADVGRTHHVIASHYDIPARDRFNPSLLTSSGETFRALDADTAASPIYPDGTRLLIYAPSTGGAAVIRVNDAGPYWSGRSIDVSRGVAEKLGFYGRGLARVATIVLSAPTSAEARYEEGRTYAPAPGYLGHFSSLYEARAAWHSHPQAMALAALPKVAAAEGEETPASPRVVIIPAGNAQASPAPRTGPAKTKVSRAALRILLKPVKLRRPHLLAAIAKRKVSVAENAKPGQRRNAP